MEISGINNMNLLSLENTIKKSSDENFAKSLEKAMDNKDEKHLRKVCQQFESILLNMVYSEMKSSVSRSDLIPRSAARQVFEDMLDQKLMEIAADRNTTGLADMLYDQLSKGIRHRDAVSDDDQVNNPTHER